MKTALVTSAKLGLGTMQQLLCRSRTIVQLWFAKAKIEVSLRELTLLRRATNQYVTKRLSEKFQRHNITVLALATLEKRDRKVNALVTLV